MLAYSYHHMFNLLFVIVIGVGGGILFEERECVARWLVQYNTNRDRLYIGPRACGDGTKQIPRWEQQKNLMARWLGHV